MHKVAKRVLAAIAVVAISFASGTAARQNRKFDAPRPDIHASTDPQVIERGRYLVLGGSHCTDCHGDPSEKEKIARGEEVALTGGTTFHLPVGDFNVPNITPAGIGRYEDQDLARILRYGVRPDGTAVLPFMATNDLADDDLAAIISYLRSRPAVAHDVPPNQVNTLGKVVKAWVFTPRGPSEPIKKSMPPAPNAAYGRYLVHNVGNCVGCHTKLDLRTGELDGPLLGGGAIHESTIDPKKKFVAPNLTPDKSSGWIADWSEDLFVARMHAGRVHAGSPMPWPSFAKMTDDDLRAIYRYLKTVAPAAGGPDPADRAAVVLTAQN